MLKLFCIFLSFYYAEAYFTLPGKCPENVGLQENFRLADFFGKWYQAFHYSSDKQQLSNCSTIELDDKSTGIYLNLSRIDRGLFHRYSVGRLEIPSDIENVAALDVTFLFPNDPRRMMTRRYPFRILATNYNYYATVYTCQYSEIIDKHFIYVWILSKKPSLNDVSKELAVKPLTKIGINPDHLVKDDQTNCVPKYYENNAVMPVTFRFPVRI